MKLGRISFGLCVFLVLGSTGFAAQTQCQSWFSVDVPTGYQMPDFDLEQFDYYSISIRATGSFHQNFEVMFCYGHCGPGHGPFKKVDGPDALWLDDEGYIVTTAELVTQSPLTGYIGNFGTNKAFMAKVCGGNFSNVVGSGWQSATLAAIVLSVCLALLFYMKLPRRNSSRL